MSPAVVLAISFFNVFIGAFSRKQTISIYYSIIGIMTAYVAYQYPSYFPLGGCTVVGMPCGTAEQMALTWGIMGSLPLWFVSWFTKIMFSIS